MTIGIAVIGAGMMGGDHVHRIASKIAGAHVAVVADAFGDRAQQAVDDIKQLSGGKDAVASTDPHAAIRSEDVDAVIIATRDDSHEELVLECIKAGKPVMCEKPLAPTEQECRRIVDAEIAHVADGGHRLVSVGFMRRFDAGCVALRRAVETEQYGKALIVHCAHRNVDPMDVPNGTEHTINGSAVHEFDFIPWLMGQPIEEVAWLGSRSSSRTERRDPQLLLLRTADGTLTTLEMFIAATYGYQVSGDVVFEQGIMSLRDPAPVDIRSDQEVGYTLPADSLPRYDAAYDVEIQAWVESIVAGGDPDPRLANAWDGLLATRSSDKMVEAMHNGDGRFIPVDAPAIPDLYAHIDATV